MGLVGYYGFAIVIFIAFCVYNLLFFTTFKADICPEIEYTVDGATDETAADEAATGGVRLF